MDERGVNGGATEAEQTNADGLHPQRERERKYKATCRDDENSGVNQAVIREFNRKESAHDTANHHGGEH